MNDLPVYLLNMAISHSYVKSPSGYLHFTVITNIMIVIIMKLFLSLSLVICNPIPLILNINGPFFCGVIPYKKPWFLEGSQQHYGGIRSATSRGLQKPSLAWAWLPRLPPSAGPAGPNASHQRPAAERSRRDLVQMKETRQFLVQTSKAITLW